MRDRSRPLRARAFAAALLCALIASAGQLGPALAAEDTRATLEFAVEMARLGNWREAKFRWELAARQQPKNSRILNNLAVAHEALGDAEAAFDLYERARALSGGDQRIRLNKSRFERFWEGSPERSATPETMTPREEKRAISANGKGKPLKIAIELPVPARLDVEGDRTLLVASFLTEESSLLDVNRELVRFLRSEFRKRASLEVLGVTPPPAIPEQTLEDLIANREFWKYLGREYEADLIVSGVVRYDRRDSSGFQDVDAVSPTTGQKVRRTQFVEQERFRYELDIIFMDGGQGTLRFRDRLQRSAIYRGTQNDPITAFYEMSESLAAEVLAIVKERTREDTRVIFKN